MAFYAAFITLVGVPLLCLAGDVTRAWAFYIRLTNATEAGCEAYANTLDVEYFQQTLQTRADEEALGTAWRIFSGGAPSGASIYITSRTEPSEKNKGQYLLVARCTGTFSFSGFFKDYSMSHFAMAQGRFGSVSNWP